jgi:isopenicillin N synthase-like dioxygenase
VINTGDVMQVWSNDRYRAPTHRVKAQKHAARYSAPFFYNPSYGTNYAPCLPSVLSGTEPPRWVRRRGCLLIAAAAHTPVYP